MAGCTYASGAGELGVIRAGPAVAADAVGPGGMACAANKIRQPPEARPYRGLVGADGGPAMDSRIFAHCPAATCSQQAPDEARSIAIELNRGLPG